MERARLIFLFLVSISLLIGCRKKESERQGQTKVYLDEKPKSVQVDASAQEVCSSSNALPQAQLRVLYVFGFCMSSALI